MKTLARSITRGLSCGEPLPVSFPSLKQVGVNFRRSDIQLIAGPPGSMKTMFMLNVVDKMGPSVPTLYHSSDSSDFAIATRVYSMKSGVPFEEAQPIILNTPEVAQAALKEFEHVKWTFRSDPDLEYIAHEAEAFLEVHGTYPHHTIIDILSLVSHEGIGEYNYQPVMAELAVMAREQQTAFTLVHHSTESATASAKAGTPPPSSAILGKPGRLPGFSLTLCGSSEAGTLKVATVKNRYGPSDQMAGSFITLKVDAPVCRISEMPLEDVSASVPNGGFAWDDEE